MTDFYTPQTWIDENPDYPQSAARMLVIENGIYAADRRVSSLALFDVKTYGAIGDGVTDDTTNIQAALTACRLAGGGTVYRPTGTYLVTADLIIGSNTTLSGPGIIKRQSTSATVAVIKNYDRTTYTDTDIVIEGGTIWRDGEATTANTPLDNVIQLVGVTRATVRNCRVRGGAKGVHMYGSQQWNVTGCTFDTFVDNGFASNPSPTSTNTDGYGRLSNNYFATPTASGFSLGSSSVIVCQSWVEIENNMFVDCATNAIEAGFNVAVVSHLTIVGNTMVYTGASSVHNSILFTDRCDDVLVEANTIEKGSIINAVSTLTDFNNRVSVIGNRVNAGSILLRNTKHGSIIGNTQYAAGTGSAGITVSSCQDILVGMNTASYNGKQGFWMVTNGLAAANARIRLVNNMAVGNGVDGTAGTTYGYMSDGGDTIQFVNNRAYDPLGASGTQTHGLYINATTNYVDWNNDLSGNKTAERAAFTTAPTRASGHGSVLGFFAATPVAKPTAYTQTYATAARTVNPASTSAFVSTPGTLAAAATLADLNTLRTDLLVAIQNINSVIDDMQAYGLLA